MANATLTKFGYPDTLVREWDHWAVLVRAAQVTLGSLVLVARDNCTAFADLPGAAFEELAMPVRAIETALARFSAYERLNYLMLMMVDPNVHFHVIPRYSSPREWHGDSFADEGWPGPPQLKSGTYFDPARTAAIRNELRALF